MTVELWTLDGDEHVEEVIAVFRMALGMAEEAEVIHPETVTALRQWCNVEYKRIHPMQQPRKMSRLEEVKAALARSPHAMFWESLQPEQEVRWTGTKNATYFVVDPQPVEKDPDNPRSPDGQYIELRRHSGLTFWTHIGKVRPLDQASA